jgi:hypothetical protein
VKKRHPLPKPSAVWFDGFAADSHACRPRDHNSIPSKLNRGPKACCKIVTVCCDSYRGFGAALDMGIGILNVCKRCDRAALPLIDHCAEMAGDEKNQ